MTYRLKYDLAVEAIHDALPPQAREQLTIALADACDDPLGATGSYGHEDDVMRTITTPDVRALLLIGHNLKTITVLRIDYLG